MQANIATQIIFAFLKNPTRDLDIIRRDVLRGQKLDRDISKSDLLKAYHKLVKSGKIKPAPALEKSLIKRAIRTLSGVAIVTNLTKPYGCPGKCIYCPTEARMPKSYLSDEPAAARALALKFDPYEQTLRRLQTLGGNGHPTDKIELIIKGGTWNFYPLAYQYWFILRCFEACNLSRAKTKPNEKIDTLKKKLLAAQQKNESARHRIIGLTLETRPDYIDEKNILVMRDLGCTRVELGVQTIDDKILKTIKRGHDTTTVKRATALLKNYGFKVDFHLMPQLPGSTPAKDLKMMKEIFSDSDYRPDMIKIYPCTVVKNSELYDWLRAGKYRPYSDKNLIDVLKKFKAIVPRYVRISRLIRDIPSHHIQAGNMVTNLRQTIQTQMAAENLKCNCLRCREAGHQKFDPKKIKLKFFDDKYSASGGVEHFLSIEDTKRNIVFAFCRLRLNKKSIQAIYPAFIRELHTYGQMIPIAESGKIQHTGLGKTLLKKAEEICAKNKIKKVAVISGVGVRGYYQKLGYRMENGYMVKNLQ